MSNDTVALIAFPIVGFLLGAVVIIQVISWRLKRSKVVPFIEEIKEWEDV